MKLFTPILLLLPITSNAQFNCFGSKDTSALVVVNDHQYLKPVDSVRNIRSITVLCDSVAGVYYGWRALVYGVVVVETEGYKRKRKLFRWFRF